MPMSQMKGTPSFSIEALILSSNPMNAGYTSEGTYPAFCPMP